ncbi:hypothetical protein [Nocardia sp. 852002-51244_SCH5132740]|uniref:hypothetical protein n=1 Tax=Nocardia sp. 852002-51244_SCH5132740 TaxID=1834099 RepID=UPI0007E9B66D|nr:hypothetical protein [Nocardia sp. 852002-51244_SCH5132740]OBB45805.1 hypothetical protein A5748_25345 [Nocardia sp. 852002-51244_SCH5132740]
MNSAEHDSQDHSAAVCRYRVVVEVPTPDDYLYDEATSLFVLRVTSPYLPRVGEELHFDVLDGLDLALTVTGVTHNFRHERDSPTGRGTDVVAEPQQHDVTVAQRLLVDPELLLRWADQLPDVEVVPIPLLVKAAAMYRERHPVAALAAAPDQKPVG